MMQRLLVPLLLFASVTAAHNLARAQTGGSGVAMVVKLSGAVDHAGKPLALFDVLRDGEHLSIPANARLTLGLLGAAGRTEVVGPATLKVGRDGVSKLGGKGSVSGKRDAAATPAVAAQLKGSINWDRMAGVRREDLRWETDDRLGGEPARLRWVVPDDLTEVEVEVESLPDYSRVYRSTLPAHPGELALPLKPGSYALHLRGFSPRRTVEAAVPTVQVMTDRQTEAQRQIVEAALSHNREEELSEVSALLLQNGQRRAAAPLLQRLARLHPEDARLQQLAAP